MSRLSAQFAKLWSLSGKVLHSVDSVNYRQLKVDDTVVSRLRYIIKSLKKQMDKECLESSSSSSCLVPPEAVRGMTQLRREAFTKVVKIPAVKIPKSEINATKIGWKSLQLKIRAVRPVAELSDSDPERKTHSLLLLDPDKLRVEALSENQKTMLQSFGLDLENPNNFEVELHYNNWSLQQIMKAVLPSDADNVSSFTQIGHIAHLNLKEASLPYKSLIGEVIMDKIPTVKTVINKDGTVDNTFRNFKIDLLGGEERYVTEVRENGCVFELDFSKVYWNSRLGSEHQHVVDLIQKDSIVYDVFAGVGPFAVPLAKRKCCIVYANDLNPVSFQYLKSNMELNKIKPGLVTTYNMDGRDFIKSVVKTDLINRITKSFGTEVDNPEMKISNQASGAVDGSTECEKCHEGTKVSESVDGQQRHVSCSTQTPCSYVIMNLPALAVDFLDSFRSILHDLPEKLKIPEELVPFLPHIICYAFLPKLPDKGFDELNKELQIRIENAFGQSMAGSYDVRIVRNVAPNKEMVCVSFKLLPSIVLGPPVGEVESQESVTILAVHPAKNLAEFDTSAEPESKRQKLSS